MSNLCAWACLERRIGPPARSQPIPSNSSYDSILLMSGRGLFLTRLCLSSFHLRGRDVLVSFSGLERARMCCTRCIAIGRRRDEKACLCTHEMETALVSVGASRSNSPPSFLTASGTVKLFVSVASLKYGFLSLSKVKVTSYSRGSEVE